MIPRAIEIGPLTIHLYGILLATAMGVGGYIASRYAAIFKAQDPDFPVTPDDVWDALLWGIVFGILGARLYHVIDLWQYYLEHPELILAVWRGGLGIFGAIGGGVLGLFLFARRREATLLALLDVAAFAMPVAQAIGRLGNFVNQELYGKPTDLPWAVFIEEQYRLSGYEAFSHFHPLFGYEALLNLILVFGGLAYLARRRALDPGQGKYFAAYLIGYSVVRFLLEPLRLDSWRLAGIPTAQLVSVALAIGAVVWLQVKRRDEAPSQSGTP